MPFSNYIYEYFDGISSGNITVGKWVRLLYEYIVKGLQEGLFTFNAKKANKAIRFVENFCHHCEGRTDLLKLELWQKAAELGVVAAARRFRYVRDRRSGRNARLS